MQIGGDEYAVISLPAHDEAPHALTDAEREVARLLIAGLSKAEIAGRRGSSVYTVANQVAAIYAKLGVRSRAELVARWAGRL
jgi:DNA-binding CsgD family transcriptional regulator